MKPIVPKSVRRAALMLSAAGLLLAPLAAQSREKEESRAQESRQEGPAQPADPGGRGGAIDEFNFGPVGSEARQLWQDSRGEGGTRLLSGQVVDMKGRTLYVERQGVIIPLDMSALRIHKTPKVGQRVIAEYQVNENQNVALSLAGETTPPPAAQ